MAVIRETDITMTTIRDTLNGAGGNVGVNLTSFFSTDAKLNMWSKYKPVVSPDLFHDLEIWQSTGYKGGGTCGLTIPTKSTISTFSTAMDNGEMKWTYVIPSGGTTAPMRLGDFRGYDTNAQNPIGVIDTNGIADVNGYVTFNMESIMVNSLTNLTFNDITINKKTLDEYYPGVYAKNGSTYKYITSTKPISENTQHAVKLLLTSGKWQYAPFLCSAMQTGQEQEGVYISVNTGLKEITVKSHSTLKIVQPHGTLNIPRTAVINIHATLYNNDGRSTTFDNIKIKLVKDDPDSGSQIGSIVEYGKNVTVDANSKKILTDWNATINFSNESYSQDTAYFLIGWADNVTPSSEGLEELMPE